MPKVTVLMPVYNGEKYLQEAIESILNQTFSDFEFLIINDGSTDSSAAILQSYKDPRIRLIHNDRNLKLPATLNKGISLSAGEYIARMDCDDISLPQRLEQQVKAMEKHQEIGILGTAARVMGTDMIWKNPCSHNEIKCHLLFYCPLTHPTVIFRKDTMMKLGLFYHEDYLYPQDFELWIRSIEMTTMNNLDEILLQYRIHPNQMSFQREKGPDPLIYSLFRKQLQRLGINPTDQEIMIHRHLVETDTSVSAEEKLKIKQWLDKILEGNRNAQYYDQNALESIIYSILLQIE